MEELLSKKKWKSFRRINFFLGCVGLITVVMIIGNKHAKVYLEKSQSVTEEKK